MLNHFNKHFIEKRDNINTDKDLHVGNKAQITANVKANNATIAGQIQGSIKIKGHLDLKSTANIEGDR